MTVLRTTCPFCGYHHDRITAIEAGVDARWRMARRVTQ